MYLCSQNESYEQRATFLHFVRMFGEPVAQTPIVGHSQIVQSKRSVKKYLSIVDTTS